MTVAFQNGSYLNGGATAGSLTTSGGVSFSSFYNTDYLENKYAYNDTKEGYEVAYAGRDAAISTKINNFCTYIQNGQEDKAMKAYRELIQEISGQERYGKLTENESQLKSIARQMIETQLGCPLDEYIKANTANSFQRGLEINWDGDQYQEEDLLKETCDLDETGNFDEVEKVAGGVASVGVATGVGAAIGAVAGGILGAGVFSVGGALFGAKIGAGLGAAVGTIAKFLGF